MKINTYNTGATYSPMGQRVAWTVLLRETVSGSSLVAFFDADRHVHNLVRVAGEPTKEKVHAEYLNCNYLREFLVPQNILDGLQCAAEHGHLTFPPLENRA